MENINHDHTTHDNCSCIPTYFKSKKQLNSWIAGENNSAKDCFSDNIKKITHPSCLPQKYVHKPFRNSVGFNKENNTSKYYNTPTQHHSGKKVLKAKFKRRQRTLHKSVTLPHLPQIRVETNLRNHYLQNILSNVKNTQQKTHFRTQIVDSNITFKDVNIPKQFYAKKFAEEKQKSKENQKIVERLVSNLYEPLPKWLGERIKNIKATKRTHYWDLLKEALLTRNLLKYTINKDERASLEDNLVRFRLKWILNLLPDFKQFRGELLNTLIDNCELRYIKKDITLFMKNGFGKYCYLILDGEFELISNNAGFYNKECDPRGLWNNILFLKNKKDEKLSTTAIKKKILYRKIGKAYDIIGLPSVDEVKYKKEYCKRSDYCTCISSGSHSLL